MKPPTKPPTLGRPRTGTQARRYRPDERVSAFVKVTGRYPAPVAARLRALAQVQGEPLWSVLVQAAEEYLDTLPAALRRDVERRGKHERRQLDIAARESYEKNLETKARAAKG